MPKVRAAPTRRSSRNLNSTVNYKPDNTPETPPPRTPPRPVQRRKPSPPANLEQLSNAELEEFFEEEAKANRRRCKKCLNVFQPRANIFRAHLKVCSGAPKRKRTTSRSGPSPTKDDVAAHFTKHGERQTKMKCNFCNHLFARKPETLRSHLSSCQQRPDDVVLGVGAPFPQQAAAVRALPLAPPVDAAIAEAQFEDTGRNNKKKCIHCGNLFPNKIDTLRSHLQKCAVYEGPGH